MKNDHLERIVKENRDQLDHRVPAESNWTKIAQTLFGKEKVFFLNTVTFWRAAAILLFGLSAYLFIARPRPDTSNKLRAQQEFTDIESYYSAQIIEKAALISDESPFADDSFTQDIQKLEAMYTVLAEEMKRQPSEKVKDALVLNMLVRIDLLNQQIQRMEESKRSKDKAISSI